MLDPQHAAPATAELIDVAAIAADLDRLADIHSGHDRELRTAVAQRLKAALTQARTQAEQLLLKDRHGRR
jgi:[protein-PII] uridylyltransferase